MARQITCKSMKLPNGEQAEIAIEKLITGFTQAN